MKTTGLTAAQRTARDVAADFKRAREHWGIPERTPRIPGEALSAAARLPIVIEHYTAGDTIAQIDDHLGVAYDVISQQIARARRAGVWPEELRRGHE